ncbi:MAG: NAD(P)-dependent dehydrogenase (short-subunit alcohol dehydrogenase family) [Hyphomicrobiaceae bacterium]
MWIRGFALRSPCGLTSAEAAEIEHCYTTPWDAIRVTALELAKAGADVAVAGRDIDAANQIKAKIQALGRRSLAVKADVGKVADIDAMIDAVLDEFGGIDILINNAGVARNGGLLEIDEDTWDFIQNVNAKGTFFCTQRVARRTVDQRRGGRIINVSSIGAKGFRGTSSPAYAASKGAVNSLTHIAAIQLAPHSINVNAICPGLVETQTMRAVFTQRAADTGASVNQLLADMKQIIPLGQIGEPEDIAAMATFLAGPGGRNITGQTINIDGGLVMS